MNMRDLRNQPAIMVESGGCSYVQKTRNIEKVGGFLAIIIDRDHNKSESDKILGDDGSGSGLRIPAILIDSSDGDELTNYYNSQHRIYANSTGHVLNLNSENFDSNVKDGDEAWIIEFYHP